MFAKNDTKFRTEEAGLELARRSPQPVQFQKPEALSGETAVQDMLIQKLQLPGQPLPAGPLIAEASCAPPLPVPS